jgi:hypothetical protein
MIVVQWSSGAPGLQMAMVDAETGEIYCPRISFHGIGATSFDLPLLTVGLSISRNPELQFRSDSRLFVIEATPRQTQQHPSYRYYFLWQDHRWTLLKASALEDRVSLRAAGARAMRDGRKTAFLESIRGSVCSKPFDLLQFLASLREQAGIAAVVHLHPPACRVYEQQIFGPDRHWKSARRILTENLCCIPEIPTERPINSDPIHRSVVEFIVR